ncbi:hypothetical protein Patl1_04942 [Pistacia atlantica]|uniref:Uncharacterized protein n=1 Tax=Pistacia atlantica TaxID=434234 RepID=A0ACC1BTT3_9ROSI|nr:hypothetical protein Patl1_04942 [Pistacia atlantica]
MKSFSPARRKALSQPITPPQAPLLLIFPAAGPPGEALPSPERPSLLPLISPQQRLQDQFTYTIGGLQLPCIIFPLPEPVAPVISTPDGLYLFTGGVSGSIYVISLPSGDILRSFSAHKKPVTCLEISIDGSLLISGGDDGRIVTVPIFQLVDHHTSG